MLSASHILSNKNAVIIIILIGSVLLKFYLSLFTMRFLCFATFYKENILIIFCHAALRNILLATEKECILRGNCL